MKKSTGTVLILTLILLFSSHADALQFPKFKTVTVDPQIDKVCYALTTADVNGDKKLDLVGVSDRAVYWYENPTWKKHTIIADQTIKDNVCIAPYDIDGDGKVDFALGAGWTGTGTISWLKRGATGENWKVIKIATERWTHRMRFADVLGTGKAQLVVSPLNKTVGNGVRFTAFSIPINPEKDRWKPTILNSELNRMHNHWHVDFDQDGTMDTLTASQEGVSLITRKNDTFKTRSLTSHGAGEVKTGHFVGGQKMFVTIEPMHGTQAVAYVEIAGKLHRTELETEMRQGHAVWLADLNGEKGDEVIIGHREAGTGKIKGPGVYLFAFDQQKKAWVKHVLDDGGCAAEDALAADFNGDGKIDIAAGGRSTHNVRIYFNQGK